MPLIKADQSVAMFKDAIVLNMDDVTQQAAQIKASAQQAAEKLIADARAKAQKVTDDHAEEGYEKGYYIGDEYIKGDYNVLKQDNYGKIDQYDMGYMDGLKTEIFVHVDTINNPKFQLHIKEFLLFTGYSNNIVKYKYQEKLYNERDITIILGEDWDRIGNLPLCDNSIN